MLTSKSRLVVMDPVLDSQHRRDGQTPTASHFHPQSHHPSRAIQQDQPFVEPTPTRDSFSLSEKRPLSPQQPSSRPNSFAAGSNDGDLSRQESLQSLKSNDTHASSTTGANDDAPEASGDEENGGYRPQKKKKSQRFFCTDYPPCNLSFTRSEHLARHIRKHTGERPFQCHCLRRFSRLDNLRQHAQTVHVNEDIPVDSLAATGTRFQRQIRTERMRPTGHRQRTSTLSSGGGQSRGHSRNLSGSSVGSVSEFGSPEDGRRRPQPLAMATPVTPQRQTLSVDTFSANATPPYYQYSPSGYSTPMSAYSAEATSPRVSMLGSPINMYSRTTIGWGGQNHSRRLSVPTGISPFHPHHGFATPQAPFMSPLMAPTAPMMSTAAGAQVSPPRDGGQHDRQLSMDAAEAEWRRRTWHPGTRNSLESRPATSGLSYQQRPDDPQAVPTTQPAAQQAVRLPGIDSFDRSTLYPSSSGRRVTEGTEIDEVSMAGEPELSSKRNSWNSVNNNMTQMELSQVGSPRESALWRHSTGSQSQAPVRPPTAPQGKPPPNIDDLIDPNLEPTQVQVSAQSRSKRQGMIMGAAPMSPSAAGEPGPAIRTSPDGSTNSEEVHTPSAAADYKPAIVHSDGHVEGHRMSGSEDAQKIPMPNQSNLTPFAVPAVPAHSDNHVQQRSHDTERLDALVAVATSEDQAIAQH